MFDSKPIDAATLKGVVGVRRVTLYGVLVFFLFVFGALFAGFVAAHLFPDAVMSVAYGVRTDKAGLVSSSDSSALPGKTEASVPERPVSEHETQAGFSRPVVASAMLSQVAAEPPASTTAPLWTVKAIGSQPGALARRKPPPPAVATQELPPPPLPPATAAPPLPPTPVAQTATPPLPAPLATPPLEQVTPAASPPPRVVPRQKPVPPAQAALTAPAIPVGSFLPKDQLDLAVWGRAEVPSGYLDAAILARTGAKLDGQMAPKADDLIDVHGWAGDRLLGLRFDSALISLCGKVVARARVGEARPDVARAMHPNLTRSGWRTRLVVAHLPRCANAQLQAWGVVPGARVLVPLAGIVLLELPPLSGPPPPGAPLFQPKDVAAPKLGPIAVLVELVDLRHCGSTDCAVTAQVGGGTHQGYVADQAGDWALVILGERAGWLPRAQFRAGP